MAGLVSDLIHQTRRLLYGSHRFRRTTLDNSPGTGGTSLVMAADVRIAPNDLLCVNTSTSWEEVNVVSYTVATRTAVVTRAINGSTALSLADGDEVEISPRFTSWEIAQSLKEDILTWPNELYRVVSDTVSVSANAPWVDLPSSLENMTNLIEVRLRRRPIWAVTDSTVGTWDSYPVVRHSNLVHSMDTGNFAGGTGIQLGATSPYASDLRVIGALPFDVSTFDADTDLLDDCGIPATMWDIPPLGAAQKLVLGQEFSRLDRTHQPEPRTAEESPPAANLQLMAGLQVRYNRRIREEIARLHSIYPMRY